jgi:predicted DNA-binding transcriptional regulator AlpA
MITGWKNITEHTGFSRNTIVRLMKEEGFPLQYIATKPTTTAQAIQKWFDNRIEQSKSASN